MTIILPIILYNDPELIIALKRRVDFIYPHDLQIFKSVEIPEDFTKLNIKPLVNKDENKEEEQQQQNGNTEMPYIQNVAISPNRDILAVTTSGQKALLLYKCFPVATKLLSVRAIARASSSLAFTKNGERLLITDKTGDCYLFDCIHTESPPLLLLGHLSIVYKVLWSPDERHIITCDRDDKIRVTNYPDTYDIHAYCLGHKEFVADLALLPNEQHMLLSISGDKTLHLWNFESGLSLTYCELPAPGYKLAVRFVETDAYEVAVLLYQHDECAAIYRIEKNQHAAGETVWTIKEKQRLKFEGFHPTDLCFVEAQVYIVGIEEQRFKLHVAGDGEQQKVPENWLEMVHEQFKEVSDCKAEDLSVWFKKHYDNVSEYLERKKRRIEDKLQSKKQLV